MLPILLLFLLGRAIGSPIANQYIDSVLNTALQNELRLMGLDPAVLSNFVTEFQDKVKIIGKVKGKAEYTHGNLTGLSLARRMSECQGPTFSYGEKSINCTINFDNLKVNYDGKLKYGKMPKINIKGKGNFTTTHYFIQVANSPARPQPYIKNFYLNKIGQLSVKFSGLGPLNRFMKVLEDGFKSHLQTEMFYSVTQRLKSAFERAVYVVPMPN